MESRKILGNGKELYNCSSVIAANFTQIPFVWSECTSHPLSCFSIWTNLSKLLNSLQFCDAARKNLPDELEKCKFIHI